jgi:peptidase M23-like protein
VRLYPAIYAPGGEFGLGTITGGPMVGVRDVTTLYGVVDGLHPEGHSGIDMGWYIDQSLKPAGNVYLEPVLARIPGTILRAGFDSVNGNHAIVLHGDWTPGTIATGYMHLAEFPGWAYGDYVPAGFTIGLCDSTGFSTGHHLHFMMWVVGPGGTLDKVNPLDYFGVEPPPPPVDVDGTPEGSYDVPPKVLRQMDIALAQVAIAVVQQELGPGRASVQLVDTGNDQQVGVLLTMSRDAVLAAYPPGF